MRQGFRALEQLDSGGAVLDVAVPAGVVGERDLRSEVGGDAPHGGVAHPRDGVVDGLVEGPVDAAETRDDDLDAAARGEVEGEYLHGLLVGFDDHGRLGGQGGVFVERTAGDAAVDGLGAGDLHARDAVGGRGVEDVDEAARS